MKKSGTFKRQTRSIDGRKGDDGKKVVEGKKRSQDTTDMDVDGGSIAVEGVHGGIAEVGMKKAKVAGLANQSCGAQ